VALSSSAKYDALDSLIATLKTQYDGVPISLIEPNNTETVVSALNKAGKYLFIVLFASLNPGI
jgi:hypothetical protein